MASALVGTCLIGYAGLAAWAFGGVMVPGSFVVIGALLFAHVGWVGRAYQRTVRGAANVHELWRLVRYCDACDGVFLPSLPTLPTLPSGQAAKLPTPSSAAELMSIRELHGLLQTIDDLCVSES